MNNAFVIFILTYILIGIQNIPKLHINRPAGALLGAVAMVLFGVISLREAYAAIDLDTILFILGMMIIVAYTKVSGFFKIAEDFILKSAKNASSLLLLLIFSSGLLSSLFMNDTICLLFTPLVLELTNRTYLNPTPYLVALATSSNIGSVMTIIGNPQNMLIGLYSKIPFLEFLRILAPVTIVGLILNFLVISFIYRKEIANKPIVVRENNSSKIQIQKELLFVSLIALALLLVFLCLGFHPPAVAITLACLLILAGAAKPRKALEEVDWTLLLFFAGLFIVMKGVEESGIVNSIFNYVQRYISDGKLKQIINLSLGSSVISNIVSNVPAVILFSHFFSNLANSKLAWLTLAMSSTLAGNLTIIGSVANIIVFESAREKVKVGFFEYLKVGFPLTLITLIVGVVVLVFLS
ncbi:MAG: anion transporter [Candidatus Omnitrophica bacterium]|nr:anion transporter [Candidatus Omnitrophota bacterium]